MTAVAGRRGSALLVIDVQQGVVAQAHDRDGVVGRVAGLVERARRDGVPVVWVQHSSEELPRDSADWALVPELQPAPDEPVVHKRHGDTFEETDLEQLLDGIGVRRLVVTGAQTDACVRSTLHGGFVRGYDVTLVADAHTTEDLTAYGAPPPEQVIAHTNMYWSWQTGPGRTAAVQSADAVDLRG